MNEFQFKNFMYICKKKAMNLHFLDSNVMNILLLTYKSNNGEKVNSYSSVVYRNARIVEEMNLGVCITMTCYLKKITEEMNVEEVYLMESFNSHWPNTVLLYKKGAEYLVCDLAQQVRVYEQLNRFLGEYLAVSDQIPKQKTELLQEIEKVKSIDYISQSLKEYFKQYPEETCQVLYHNNNEDLDYDDVPRISIKQFLLQNKVENDIIKK